MGANCPGDQRLIELVQLWLKMGIVRRDGTWKDVMGGVRQGQVLAPLLANLYLHDLDRFVDQQGWGYVRYADDYLLLTRERRELENASAAVVDYLAGIGLRLNDHPRPLSSLDKGGKHSWHFYWQTGQPGDCALQTGYCRRDSSHSPE